MQRETFTDFAVHVAPTDDGGTDVTVFGELDLATVDKVSAALDSVLTGSGHVVIDLRACPFVDSTGIAAIARAAIGLREQGRPLRIRGVRERVRRILEISGLLSSDLLVAESADEPNRR
jgi:anti-anti-sigma factor